MTSEKRICHNAACGREFVFVPTNEEPDRFHCSDACTKSCIARHVASLTARGFNACAHRGQLRPKPEANAGDAASTVPAATRPP